MSATAGACAASTAAARSATTRSAGGNVGAVLAGSTVTADLDEEEVSFCRLDLRRRPRAETAGATWTRARAAGTADHGHG
jgi:hypothetical protein